MYDERAVPPPQSKEMLEAHCGRGGCLCAHRSCFKGWIDSDDTTAPCPVCREDLSRILSQIPGPGHRGEADFRAIQFRHSKNAESD